MKNLITLVLILATATAMASSTPAPPPPPDTAATCKENYESSSSARHTCSGERFDTVDSDKARVWANCEDAIQVLKKTVTTVDASECGNLANCSGVLQLGEC